MRLCPPTYKSLMLAILYHNMAETPIKIQTQGGVGKDFYQTIRIAQHRIIAFLSESMSDAPKGKGNSDERRRGFFLLRRRTWDFVGLALMCISCNAMSRTVSLVPVTSYKNQALCRLKERRLEGCVDKHVCHLPFKFSVNGTLGKHLSINNSTFSCHIFVFVKREDSTLLRSLSWEMRSQVIKLLATWPPSSQ